MKRFLSVLCVLAMLLSIVPAAAFAAQQDLQALIDAGADEPIVLEADASNITVTRDTYVDLNGHDIDGVTVLSGTLYCLDSQTADYTVADGVYGKVTNATGAVKAAEGYLQVGDSFHAVNLDIYAMTLRAADVGVYYKSNFAADEIVAAQVESFGVALSVVTAPNAENLDSYCGYSVFEGFEAGEGANSVGTSTLLKGIMKAANGDNKNAKNAAMPIYGRAYIKTAEGYIFGETVKRSLQEQVEAIDKVWNKLTDAQKAPVLGMLEAYTSVMEGWNIPNIKGGEAGEGAGEITVPVEVTTENGVVTETVTVEQGAVSITVPAGVKLSEGANKLTLTVTPKETSDAGLTLEKSEVLMPMDVHVEGLAADNAQPITIYLGKVMAENLNMGNYTVYHVENGKANEMTLIGVNEEFTAHNQYKYSLDGELTLYVANFSEFTVVSEAAKWKGERDYSWYNTTDNTLYIRNADQLAAFSAIVGGMANQKNDPDLAADIAQDSFENKTVILLADIDLNDAEENNQPWIFHPIGYWNNEETYERKPVEDRTTAVESGFYAFMGTFDGNGNTISNFYHNTWEIKGDHNWYSAVTEQYFRDGMGLFGKVYGGTVKNLTVANFSSDGEITTTGVIAAYADSGNGKSAVFENIAIVNCNPRVYNIGNGGIVGCAGWYSRNEDLSATNTPVIFRNITVDQTNKISALWGTYDVSCGGILGQYYPDSNCGLEFENCHIAAIIDVNNDVCANYQYYWYRYSGMLMGTVRKNTTKDGYTVADTTGIKVTGCTYIYGSWNEYWYCELVKNSSASYTHDYQFGRLTNIDNLTDITSDNGVTWLKEGNFALVSDDRKSVECYHIFENSEGQLYRHFHDQPDESNPSVYEDFDLDGNGHLDDLKEDRQRYYLPFGQVLNGLGYGVKPTYTMEGFTLVEDGTVISGEKFEQKADAVLTYIPGERIYLKDLVKLGVDISKLSQSSLYAAVSPVAENGVVSATYSRDVENWENNYIVFSNDSKDAAKLVITDYFYCTPTVIYLNPVTAAPKFEAKNVEERDAYTTITLGELFDLKAGATISGDVIATVTAPNGKTTITGTPTDWETKTIDLTQAGEWTIVIVENDPSCTETTNTIVVNEIEKFVVNAVGAQNAYTQITLGDLFDVKSGITIGNVTATVTDPNGNETIVTGTSADWATKTIDLTKAGTWTIVIKDDDSACTETTSTIVVNKIEKFTANTVDARDAYTQITLGDLFALVDGATISANVTATVTAPNGTETTVTVADWAAETIDLTQDGQWKVVIIENDASCEATTATFTVNKADKFDKKFNKDFLYRVGNENEFNIGYIFGEAETAVALNSANVQVDITKVDGDVTWTVAPNTTTWTSGKLKFTGTGVVKVTISAEAANDEVLMLEVINAKNLTSAEGATGTEKQRKSVVLIKDVNTATYCSYTYANVYGNGFTYSLNGAPTTYRSQQGHGILIAKNALFDNVVIVGDIYNSYGAYTNQNYYNVAIDCAEGNSVIRNCYIANCAAPGRTRAGSVTIENTTLYGGTVANWILDSGTTMLNNVTTANFDDGRKLVGMGIVFHPDATEYSKLIISGTLKQYNFMSEAKVPDDTYAKEVHTKMFSSTCSKYHFGSSPNRYANAGIVAMTDKVTFSNITDEANTGYSLTTGVQLGDKVGFVYSQPNTLGTVDNGYNFDTDLHVASSYGIVEPDYDFDYTEKNYQAKEEGKNDYCYEEGGVVYISMDEGDTFNWDTSILTAEKVGNTLEYTVSMNGIDYTGKSIAFNTAGDYTVTYSYTDPYNYTLDANGNITTYSARYEKTVQISVAVIEATTKHAVFTFGSNNTASTTVTVGTQTYVMPNVSGTSNSFGSTTVNGQTIYYPIVEIIMSDGKTNHSAGWNAYFPVFSGVVTITDYKDEGRSDETVVYNGTTTSMPTNLSVNGTPSQLFKYQSKSNAGESPVVKNNKLVYSSASIEADREEYNLLVSYLYKDNANTTFCYYVGYHAPAQKYSPSCFTSDTLVTLADGTQKRVDALSFDDRILTWDFFSGSYVEQNISILVNHGEDLYRVANLQFSDGSVLRLIADHGVFDYDLNKFVYITVDNMADYVGHRFVQYNADGGYNVVTLENAFETEEYTSAWSITSAGTSNAFASGLLTVAPPEDFYNWIEMDGKLHYDVEQFQKDVETYGLYTYDVFADYVTYDQFVDWNGAYLKIAVEKGYFTFEYILELIELYKGWMPQ